MGDPSAVSTQPPIQPGVPNIPVQNPVARPVSAPVQPQAPALPQPQMRMAPMQPQMGGAPIQSQNMGGIMPPNGMQAGAMPNYNALAQMLAARRGMMTQ